MYIHRHLESTIREDLEQFPAVAILGPRQSGKSTLARHILTTAPNAVNIDLEDPSDRVKLTDPGLFFQEHHNKLICLDEIQRVPELFPILRGIIDRNEKNGQFLILGSASRDLIRQSSETLAGRIIYNELPPFQTIEIPEKQYFELWIRGGFPRSYLASDDQTSIKWRKSFISAFLERDLAMLGFNYPPETMRRLWSMCAHSQSQLINLSKFGASLGVSHTQVRNYLDLLKETFMVRLLPPVSVNLNKRLVKSPKIFLRDTGILHGLLDLSNMDQLMGHPVFGPSWESFVIENLLNQFHDPDAGFFRTSNGTEIDLVIRIGNRQIGIETKVSSTPKVEAGFYHALRDLKLDEGWIIAPVKESFPLSTQVYVKTLHDALHFIE